MTAAGTTTRVVARAATDALFVGSAVTGRGCAVALGAAALAGVGAVGLVVFVIPGSVCARVVVLPAELSS